LLRLGFSAAERENRTEQNRCTQLINFPTPKYQNTYRCCLTWNIRYNATHMWAPWRATGVASWMK
jgi:hypothetical protein